MIETNVNIKTNFIWLGLFYLLKWFVIGYAFASGVKLAGGF